MMVKVTVVIPVFDRQAELRRALASLRRQTHDDFECIVVDDGSTVPIEPLVHELGDERFRYVRNAVNGGPYNARMAGLRHMRGEYMCALDSDWEAFPWALAQGVGHLDATPDVDAVAGLHLEESESRLFVRIPGDRKIVTPAQYAVQPPAPDCVAMVRRPVVDEWLAKRTDYYALEAHSWMTFSLRHNQLYVDEPWTKYHIGGGDRVTVRKDDRRLDDYLKFIEEHADYISGVDCVVLDAILQQAWIDLTRAGRTADARIAARCLRRRGVPYRRLAVRRAIAKGRAKLFGAGHRRRAHYL